MTWNPNTTITIGGTNYTNSAFLGATVTYGRTQMNTQPRAGYCSVALADTNNSAPTINIGDEIIIKVKNTANIDVTVYTGEVSDVSSTVMAGNNIDGTYLRHNIIGVGTLGRLNRRFAGASGYSAQFDGDRIDAILSEVYATTWNEQPATLRWNAVAATKTWQLYDDYLGIIDTPGTYELAPYTSGTTNGYDLTTTAANSGLGVLYDTPAGRINYDDSDHRQTNANLNGFWTIPVDAVIASGLTQATRLGDIANTVEVSYATGSVEVTDATSVATYGPATRQYNTILKDLTDATDQATRYLGLIAYPTPQFDTLALAIHQPDLDNTTINTALAVYVGQPIQVNDLPNALGPSFTGFVEGWTWRLGQKTADLKLTVSDYARSVVTTRWSGTTPTLKWNTTSATLKWQEAIVI